MMGAIFADTYVQKPHSLRSDTNIAVVAQNGDHHCIWLGMLTSGAKIHVILEDQLRFVMFLLSAVHCIYAAYCHKPLQI